MLTQTELQKILDQINNRFDYLNNKIQKLEAQLEVSKPTATKTTKKVVEKA